MWRFMRNPVGLGVMQWFSGMTQTWGLLLDTGGTL